MNRTWSVFTIPCFVLTVVPSTSGRRSRWTPSRETSGPPRAPSLPAILSISSRKTMPGLLRAPHGLLGHGRLVGQRVGLARHEKRPRVGHGQLHLLLLLRAEEIREHAREVDPHLLDALRRHDGDLRRPFVRHLELDLPRLVLAVPEVAADPVTAVLQAAPAPVSARPAGPAEGSHEEVHEPFLGRGGRRGRATRARRSSFTSRIAASTRSRAMESTSRPTYPTSVNFEASTFTNGASTRRARRRAISVLPTPVGPIMRMFFGIVSRCELGA